MVAFLSPEWIDALDAAARTDAGLAARTAGIRLVVQQTVTGAAGDGSDVVYHVAIDDGSVRVAAGPAPDATLRLTLDRATAWAVASGTASAQAAFMTGRLQVGGDLRELVDDRLTGALGDVFAAVRAATTEGADDARTA